VFALTLDAPYEVDDEIFCDFGDKMTYKQSVTASKHILRHTAKHKQNFYEALNLTPEKLAKLFAFIVKKPIKIINDENVVREKIAEYKKELSSKYSDYEFLKENYDKYNEVILTDEYKLISKLKSDISDLHYDLREQGMKVKSLEAENQYYKKLNEPDETTNYNNLEKELSLMESYDKFKKDLEKKNKKIEEDCERRIKKDQEDFEKRMKKAQEDFEKKERAFEKKEKKLKSEIKAMKHEMEMSKLKHSSDSDSDSDSD
jgi:chromosome segregation ATPase